jgi:exosortase/archaeosortase family protein
VAVACLTAYSIPNAGRRVLVLLSAVPLAVGANLLRVIGLVVLIKWQGGEILETFVHPLSGMLTFAISLPVIFWLGGDHRQESRS